MKAIEIIRPGGPEVLRPVERPVPEPGSGEVLIRVAAAGVNRPDIMQRRGLYPPPPGASDIPGLEVAGIVVDVGSGVTGWMPGDHVCALLTGGGYAEYCVAHASLCLPIPKGLDFIQAAAIPETYFTVWDNV
ncbi:MAG TPA: NAD(P)H-quinone oxidoreductase, partial [Methylothermaceae bacterium]|nr:NAD(P)H-quinone oxidoreductase [Methylothermaceae bacterium]